MIVDELRAIVGPAPWLDSMLGDTALLRVAFAGAGRRLGTRPIGDAAAARLAAVGLPWPATVGVDEAGRAALLAAAAHAGDGAGVASLVRDLFRRGDVRERQAVLRVLAALPAPEQLVELAVDACRTNVVPVFEAIACDNPYPARYFGDPAFGQLVLKALFVGAPVARIVGLAGRVTDELVRMVDAYASERRAAGRPVPDDAKLVARKP